MGIPMAMSRAATIGCLLVTVAKAAAVPAPAPHPEITAPPTLIERNPDRLADRADVGSYVGSVFSGLGSGISSFVASGVPQYFNDLPTGTAVLSSLGISSSDLAATPTQALNVPAYANWTDQGWNVRIHGNIYKQPNISIQKQNDLANLFLVDVDITKLPQSQQDQARNLTSEIFVVQQDNEQVTVDLVNNVAVEPKTDSGAINAAGGAQTVQMPYNTTREGDFDAFVTLKNTTGPKGGYMLKGNETSQVQTLNMYVKGTETGNATAFLVPEEGTTVISDIDDILRVTKIYKPKEGLLNSFARPFTSWLNMPEIYASWSKSFPNFHFHYLTTTPEQVTKNYMDYIYKTYPLGSFDTRPLNFSDASATLSIRKALLDKIFQTFPKRRFVLVADTSNSDIMRDYPKMVSEYPGQVLCILLRNTSATDPDDRFPYDTSGFKDIDASQYMFFRTPDDLVGLQVANGQCVNSTFSQNVTFGTQGLPLGLGDDSAAGRVAIPGPWWTMGSCVAVTLVLMTGMGLWE